MAIKNVAAFLFASMLSIIGIAQMNLLPNGGFDEMKGKVKKPGQIELAKNWTSPMDPKADLYSAKSKGDFSAPDNLHGNAIPDEGNNYAGIYAYSYKNKVPLTYLSTELEYPLEEEEVYCIRMMVSLSDLSKYACNNVGLYISNQRPTSRQIQSYAIEPQILASKNRIVEEQYTFISICRMYKAEGGEKFIVIGNFAKPEDTKWKKMKRPKGFHTPQSYDAYYYIEGVSVIPMDSIEECSCEKGGIKMNVVYSENISAEANDEEEKLIANTKAYFEFNKTEILPNSKAQLDSMINMLISKPSLKLEIIGYTEEQEQLKLSDDEDISLDRAKVVFDYLVSKGIKSDRMIYKGNKDSNPVDDSNTTVARSKNRRVEFKLVK